jgi:hypothetical protein
MVTQSKPSLFSRLAIALSAFMRILGNPGFAAGVAALRDTAAPERQAVAEPEPERPRLHEVEPNAALQLLGLLQQEGRFVDFLQEDVTAFSDADVGAAARVVHEGCSKALKDHFSVAPVRDENEGSRITLEAGFDAAAVRLTGKVAGQAPYTGTLNHRGWKVTETRLPQVASGHDLSILAPAEVEL